MPPWLSLLAVNVAVGSIFARFKSTVPPPVTAIANVPFCITTLSADGMFLISIVSPGTKPEIFAEKLLALSITSTPDAGAKFMD